MNTLSDNALMLKVKEGDSQKLGLLYERYKLWVYNFFYQMHRDQAVSEDLVQNVFIRILKYKHTYSVDSSFVPWMFQIARNLNHDHFKHSNRFKTDPLDVITADGSDDDTIQQRLEQDDNHKLLYTALSKLPYDKREVLILSKMKELKYSEIGTMLGCSEEAARTRAHRALHDLRKEYLNLEKLGL